MRPLGFGEIVDGAVQLYRRDFGLYYLIGLVCSLPAYIFLVLWNPAELLEGMQAVDAADNPSAAAEALGPLVAQLGYTALLSLVAMVFAWFAGLSLTVAMAERIEERPASLGAAYGGALRRIPSAGGASILALLVFLALEAVVLVVSMFIITGAALVGGGGGGAWVAVAALLFAVALNLAAIALWYAATFAIFPAVVIERHAAINALGRSLSLCKGGWLRVLGIMTVALIVSWAPSIATAALTGTWDLFLSPGDAATISAARQWVVNTADLVVGPLTLPFMVGCVMMLFHDRRVRSEGYDLERLADDLSGAAP